MITKSTKAMKRDMRYDSGRMLVGTMAARGVAFKLLRRQRASCVVTKEVVSPLAPRTWNRVFAGFKKEPRPALGRPDPIGDQSEYIKVGHFCLTGGARRSLLMDFGGRSITVFY